MFPGENREPLDYRPQPPAVTDQVTTEVRTISRFLQTVGPVSKHRRGWLVTVYPLLSMYPIERSKKRSCTSIISKRLNLSKRLNMNMFPSG